MPANDADGLIVVRRGADEKAMEREPMEAFPVSRHVIGIDTINLSSISQLHMRLTEGVQGFLACFLLCCTMFFLVLWCAIPHCTPL